MSGFIKVKVALIQTNSRLNKSALLNTIQWVPLEKFQETQEIDEVYLFFT